MDMENNKNSEDMAQDMPEQEGEGIPEGEEQPRKGVELTDLKGPVGGYFRLKKFLAAPDPVRGEDGLMPKRFTSDNYFESTCPFCGCTAEHEGKKFHYSKKTKGLLVRDIVLMLLAAIAVALHLLNVWIALAAVAFIGLDMSKHAERKMYYSLLCRKCGAHFPMDEEEQEKIKVEEAEKKKKAEEEAFMRTPEGLKIKEEQERLEEEKAIAEAQAQFLAEEEDQ